MVSGGLSISKVQAFPGLRDFECSHFGSRDNSKDLREGSSNNQFQDVVPACKPEKLLMEEVLYSCAALVVNSCVDHI